MFIAACIGGEYGVVENTDHYWCSRYCLVGIFPDLSFKPLVGCRYVSVFTSIKKQ